ncbi:alpha/beta fold hydrolase [Clostridium estertheticum]|uniref:alpha/beta fold hydrolase n=1 Tax=Clostridium estertheticum TaxID=238834 RepID=UPI001C0D4BB5|nr:alpha/beta hydrolase [Clostridium estertheticum]MBU3071881.1 alpha/beta hydrolase [Clostridium estertheticum]MBU3161973.1 alpha/beta hydrolase [Clostridium estertheticum]MBU3171190.1 alpha/beta hydrolase [Clostridium estertheticum]MBU3183300.1 alpha/beta hydrolase [Clostridium estertheticum]
MNKPYLIMLPGFGMNSCVWKRISGFLSRDFELIFIEWDNIDLLDGFKQKVINIIEEKQLPSFSLLGWSLGSLVAEEIVLDNLWNINNLILIGGTSSFIQHKEEGYNLGWNKRIVERMKSQLYKNPKATLFNFYDSLFSDEEKKKGYNTQFLKIMEDNIKIQSVDSLVLELDYLIQKDLRNKLVDVNIPLLMIHGEEDRICPIEATLYIKNILTHSNIEVIKSGGHIPFFTNPHDCYYFISKFIKKHL